MNEVRACLLPSIRILGGFFHFLRLELRSGIDHLSPLVGAALRADAVREHTRLALGTLLSIHEDGIVLLAGAIAAMSGMSLLGIGHIGRKLLTFSM